MSDLYKQGIFFVAGVAFSYLINRMFLKFSATFGNRNIQRLDGQVRWATTQKPSIGGLSFFLVFLLSFCYTVVSQDLTHSASVNYLLVGVLAPITVGFLIGLADDAYNTRPFVKFSGQFACGIMLLLAGVQIDVSSHTLINYFITVLWVVGLMNSVNMLDNMDGIVSSVSIVTLILAFALSVLAGNNQGFEGYLILGGIAALAGFLFFNWNPAKMYMGDTGSQFLGVFLAWISIKYFWNFKTDASPGFHLEQFLVPALAFTVPLMDTTTVTFRRLLRGQSPFVGGRDHTTHHLVFLGLSEKNTVRTLVAFSLVSMFVALYFVQNINTWTPEFSWAVVVYYSLSFVGLQVAYQIAMGKKQQPKSKMLLPTEQQSREVVGL